MANENPKTEGLIKHAKKKTEVTIQKVEDALKRMVKAQKTINFNSVAEEAGVSKGFLYDNKEFRNRIEHLRQQQEGLPSAKQVRRTMSDASKDVIIESLRKRISEQEGEIKKLKKQLQHNLSDIYAKI